MPRIFLRSDSRPPRVCGELVMRSCIPLLAVLVIGGTVLWGPWVSLSLATGSWRLVKHLA